MCTVTFVNIGHARTAPTTIFTMRKMITDITSTTQTDSNPRLSIQMRTSRGIGISKVGSKG